MVRPSGWTVSSRKEKVYAFALRPALMKTAWQSASIDNAIKHQGAGEERGWGWEGWASSHCKRYVTFQTLSAQRYIVPSMRTSNQHTPKQTGQQGFSFVETFALWENQTCVQAENMPLGNFLPQLYKQNVRCGGREQIITIVVFRFIITKWGGDLITLANGWSVLLLALISYINSNCVDYKAV